MDPTDRTPLCVISQSSSRLPLSLLLVLLELGIYSFRGGVHDHYGEDLGRNDIEAAESSHPDSQTESRIGIRDDRRLLNSQSLHPEHTPSNKAKLPNPSQIVLSIGKTSFQTYVPLGVLLI